ncbi:sensor histidine kinase [Chryseobacterium potabilaquae]|uniref:histidine kinase n=1 Tax=Chryseobacterium potabilaquae TaxID=2675057 RepID=A0A6N4X427_9FLAO|nr:ATP-binding protein [Chryseobacterium potabilaquae]CAA7195238.1 Oxygen sensor histidine kinase NreB [Chryseobacterium potabilaquae]
MSRWENQDVVVCIWIGIGILVFITSLIINHLNSLKTNKQKVMQLVRNTQSECWENTIYLQEKDRERLAEELHDNIISRLNLIRLNTNQKNVNEINMDLKKSMQLIRELSHNLTPPDLGEVELMDLIADYLDQVNKTINVVYHHHVEHEAVINSHIKLNVFRILQELINNILKHAKAKKVEVLLRISFHYLILIVEDNGCGFTAGKNYGGIGIRSIQSRAKQIKAIYKLKTKPQKGTKCIVCVAVK